MMLAAIGNPDHDDYVRGAAGKVLVAEAIERAPGDRRGFGRARLQIITSAKSTALREFITANIAPGATVITDALSSYPNALAGPDYEHDPINVKHSGLQAHQVMPGAVSTGLPLILLAVAMWAQGVARVPDVPRPGGRGCRPVSEGASREPARNH